MTNTTNPMRQRYHSIDGWRGYWMPARAIAGVSDTGEWSDSPCPSSQAMHEFKLLQSHMRQHGIRTITRHGRTSNVFCVKHWLTVVDPDDFAHAAQLTVDWLAAHNCDTAFIHSADLEEIGYKPAKQEEAEAA